MYGDIFNFTLVRKPVMHSNNIATKTDLLKLKIQMHYTP